MADIFEFADEFGPTKIVHVCVPSADLKGILVVDNVAAGPSIGGLRMAPDVSVAECFRLARAMTLKNAAAGLPHGGGKSVIFGDPGMPRAEKETLIRAMACALADISDYIFGPDMGTDEQSMAWIKDEIGRSVGLPAEIGGIPLDVIGATGWGLSHAVEVAMPYCDFELAGARVAVQGFGAVGKHAARFLADKGAVLVAASDSSGCVVDADGLNIQDMINWKNDGNKLSDYGCGERFDREAIIDVECDIWIPAARPDVIQKSNVHRLNTRLLVQGANIPVTYEAEQILFEKGVVCVPDFIANAGGVICAAMEYQGASRSAAFQTIEDKLRENTSQVLSLSKRNNVPPRDAAIEMATTRLKKAMDTRRWSVF